MSAVAGRSCLTKTTHTHNFVLHVVKNIYIYYSHICCTVMCQCSFNRGGGGYIYKKIYIFTPCRGGGGVYIKNIYFCYSYYGLSIYNSKRTKTPEYTEQINKTNNRVKNKNNFHVFHHVLCTEISLSFSRSLTYAHTVPDTHSRV